VILDKAGYARITDLGIARYWKSENSSETSGTPGYMAPEVLLRQNHSFSTDFYAVGIIAYEMLVG
jgi:serine/threonine protein kinase